MSDVRSRIFTHHTHRLGSVRLVQQALGKELGVLLIQPVVVGVLAFLDIVLDLLQFSTADIGGLTRTAHLLGKALHGHSTGRIGQKLQFVEIFLGLGFVLLFGDESHQYGSLGLCL